MKILIPLAIVIGLISAIILAQKVFLKETPKAEKTETLSPEPSSEGEVQDGKESLIKFIYHEADGLLSKPRSPYISPDLDLQPDTANSIGYTIKADNGIALVQNGDTLTYIVTNTTRDEHITVTRVGFNINPMIVYAEHPYSETPDQFTGLLGLYTNKVLPTGIIVSTKPNLVKIKKNTGGHIYITFTTKNREKAKAKEQEKPFVEDIQPPAKVKTPDGGGDILPPAV